jgi:hypothetical protein
MMRSQTVRYTYKRSSFEAQAHPSLAPLTELLGLEFEYTERYTEGISSGLFFPRGRGYCSTPQVEATLTFTMAEWHGYEFRDHEALAIFAMLMVEIPCLPWEYEP